ncbi:hypothetical protein Cgig2_015088 [Carnegiea gigantea]|uniref:GATA-type domain-containing protein n=1 Tax=Carnegiea gigantea TaxID=171969 RepID=A0A9Q1KQ27_9CARY|nr:hypothetical protein Cgig2_015088 [Carnegiea gigantea]
MQEFKSIHHRQVLSSKEDFDLIENYLSKPLCVPNDPLEDLPYVFDFGENPISLKLDKLLDHPPIPVPNFDFNLDFQFNKELSDSSVSTLFVPQSPSEDEASNDCNSSVFVGMSTNNDNFTVDPIETSGDKVKMCTPLLVPLGPTQMEASEAKMCASLPTSRDVIETESGEFEQPKAISSVNSTRRRSSEVKLSTGKPYTNPLGKISLKGKTSTILHVSTNPAKTRSTKAKTRTIRPISIDPIESKTNEVKMWTTLPLVDAEDNTLENLSSKFSSSEKENYDINIINFSINESQAQISTNRTRRKRTREKRARYSLEDWAFGRDNFDDLSYISTKEDHDHKQKPKRRCTHCQTEKTPQWREGPLGKGTLCNACGVRFKSGRLLPEYRPAGSPSFDAFKHSNFHREVLKMRSKGKGSLRKKRRRVTLAVAVKPVYTLPSGPGRASNS